MTSFAVGRGAAVRTLDNKVIFITRRNEAPQSVRRHGEDELTPWPGPGASSGSGWAATRPRPPPSSSPTACSSSPSSGTDTSTTPSTMSSSRCPSGALTHVRCPQLAVSVLCRNILRVVFTLGLVVAAKLSQAGPAPLQVQYSTVQCSTAVPAQPPLTSPPSCPACPPTCPGTRPRRGCARSRPRWTARW